MIKVVILAIGIVALLAWCFWPESKAIKRKEVLKDIKDENDYLDVDEKVRKEEQKLNKRKLKIKDL